MLLRAPQSLSLSGEYGGGSDATVTRRVRLCSADVEMDPEDICSGAMIGSAALPWDTPLLDAG